MKQLAGPQSAPIDSDGWSAGAWKRLGFIFSAILVFGLFGWGAFAKLAGAVVATGQLRVEAQRQVVQHIDGGVVGEIFVRDGDVVEGGAILIRLDGTQLNSELRALESQLYEIMARRGRLTAEELDLDQVDFDEELIEVARTNDDVRDLIEGQLRLFNNRRETMETEFQVMDEREGQIEEQIEGAQAEIEAINQQMTFIEAELIDMRGLETKGLVRRDRLMSLERERARLLGEFGQMKAQAAQLKGQISEMRVEELRMKATRREEATRELRELGFRELELKERRLALRERLSRLEITAPRSGIVYDMKVHALNSVIRPAEPILFIVPNDTGLVIDAQIDPINIDQVYVGQESVLRLSALNTRTTPELFGAVTNVSADAFTDEQTGISYYRAEVQLNEGELDRLDDGITLVPGMPAEVYIQTGERTPIEYLMKPLTDYFNRAAREE